MWRSGCRRRSRPWERDGSTPSRSGSSKKRPASCRPRTRSRPTPSWPTASSLTPGKLRSAAHRLVLKLDPDSVRRRKEGARRAASVRRFREDSGNTGMVARELPTDEATASWQHLEQRALDLRAAGVPGTIDLLTELAGRLLGRCFREGYGRWS
jgi:hypothetical protein